MHIQWIPQEGEASVIVLFFHVYIKTDLRKSSLKSVVTDHSSSWMVLTEKLINNLKKKVTELLSDNKV